MQKPWYRSQTKSWYVELSDGTQVNLGRDPAEYRDRPKRWPKSIDDEWHRRMSDKKAPTRGDNRVADLVGPFLERCETSEKTRGWYRSFLGDFAAHHPTLRVSKLDEEAVKAWLTLPRKRPWGPNTRRSAITILKACLNWAVKAKLIPDNPIRGMERPAAVARERVLSAAEKADILGMYPPGDPFRDFLVAMMESGARPGEIIKVEAKDVSPSEGTWTLRGKTTDATGKNRVVFLTKTLLELTARLMREHPAGPLFRNSEGNPWTLQSVNCRFKRKRNRKIDPISKDITAYVYRATWATDALENEVPDATVAELMGHSSTMMIHKHYSKLHKRRTYLRDAAERAAKKSPPGT